MIRKLYLICLFAICFSMPKARAGHILGGEIYWECLGNGDYIFHLKIYTDCTMILPTGAPSITGPMGQIPTQWIVPGGVVNSTSFNCNGACYDEVYHSVSDTVSLIGIPPASGWEFYYTTCCRAYEANLSNSGSMYIASRMYPYAPPGAHMPLNSDSCYNSSAVFTNLDPMVACSGPYGYNPGLRDHEGDSVAISFATPRTTSANNAVFASGYSTALPFPDSTENMANGPVRLNPQTGQIEAEFYDADPGNYFTVLKIQEYRYGQLIAEYERDRPLLVLDSVSCVPTTTNSRPNMALSSNNGIPLSTNGPLYTVDLKQGDTLDIDLVISDFDFNSAGVPQTICLSSNSIKLNPNNPTLDTGCVGGNCAKLLPVGNGGFCQSISGAFNLTWVPDCGVLNFNSNSPLTIPFTFEVQDDACPIAKGRQATLLVRLYPSIQVAPQLSLLAADTVGTVNLSWTKALIASNAPFEAYRIYARPLNGSYSLIDSITDRDSTQATYTGLAFPAEIYIEAVGGSCPVASPASNVLNTNVALDINNPIGLASDFTLSPNPAKDYLKVHWPYWSGSHQKLEVSIYNARGALVRNFFREGAQAWEIPLKEAQGIYILEIRGEQIYGRKKFIID